MIYVIAGNLGEYREYCHSVGESPYKSKKCCYVFGVANLFGKIDIDVLLIGTFDYRHDWPQIHRFLVKRWDLIRVKKT